MTHVPHQLTDDFPQFADRIKELKTTDTHFAKLSEAYGNINHQVHLAETNVDPVEQLTEDQLRKDRALLKDKLYAMLNA